jgi:glycosyltransferase involved in cell wall biosynthesis
MSNPRKALAIIPAHNEEDTIAEVISEIQFANPRIDILVVNDASTDGTSNAARKTGVRVADLPINLGIGGAVQTGFKVAQELEYEIVVQIDADGQHDPSCIKDIVGPLLDDKADVSIGSRHMSNGNQESTFTRYAGIKFFSWLTSWIISQRVTDCSSGFRALNRKAYRLFADDYPIDFPDAEALISAHRAGLRICEGPAKFRARNHGRSSLRSWKMLYYPFKETLSIAMMMTKKPGKTT